MAEIPYSRQLVRAFATFPSHLPTAARERVEISIKADQLIRRKQIHGRRGSRGGSRMLGTIVPFAFQGVLNVRWDSPIYDHDEEPSPTDSGAAHVNNVFRLRYASFNPSDHTTILHPKRGDIQPKQLDNRLRAKRLKSLRSDQSSRCI